MIISNSRKHILSTIKKRQLNTPFCHFRFGQFTNLIILVVLLFSAFESKAQTLVHNFEFNGNLNDSKATGVSLFSFNNANSNFNTNPNGWTWTENSSGGGGGLVLNTGLLTNPQIYSFGFRISYHETGGGYRKIISFKGPADDNGLYFFNNKLKFFPFAENPKIYSNNTFYDFILTRDAAKNIKVYIVEANGSVTEVYNEPDPTDAAVPRQSNGSYEFRLFMDDTQTNSEHTSGGSVRGIRLWDYPLSANQIATALSSVTTNDASNITPSSASLNGEINPQGNTSNFSFEYGTTTAYGKSIAGNPANSNSSAAVAVSANISGLESASTYHYRVKSVVGATTINGADKTFTTSTVGEHALHFDGTNDYISFNSSPPYTNTALTYEAWIRTNNTTIAKEIIGYGNTSGTDVVEFRISNGKLQFGIDQNNSFTAITSNTLVNTGEWFHVAAVKNGASIKLYVNGKEDGTGTLSQTPNVNTLELGSLFKNGSQSSQVNYNFEGLIDEVRIWNVARTQAQIESTIVGKLTSSETGLVASYSMNQGIPGGNNTRENTLTELKGAFNGTLQNFTLTGASSNFVDRGKLSLNPILGSLLWLKGDTGVISTNNRLNNWIDLSGNNTFTKSGTIGFKTNALNFNPLVTINNTDPVTNLPTNRLNGNTPISYVDGFAVYKQTDNNSNFLGCVDAGRDYGTALFASFGNNTSYVANGTIKTYQTFSAAGLTNNFGITNLDVSLSTTPFAIGRYNGQPKTMTTGTGSNYDTIRFVPMIGGTNNSGPSANDGWPHAKVEVAEILLFPSSLSAINKSKVETYLSLKYGITLDSSTVPNYISSNGSVLWNNKNYWHDVFGIGKDNGNSLNQSSSNSINTGSGDGNGQIGKANIVLTNPTSMDDGDYLIIGHDNGALVEQTTDLPSSLPNTIRYKRLGREWKVQHTGDIGKVALKLDLPGLCLAGIDSSHYQLLIDNDGDGNFNTGTVTVIPASALTTKLIRFHGIILPNNAVFTLAISQPTLTLQSPSGTNAQTICEGESINDIIYTLQNANHLTITGLPTGIRSSFVNKQLTISGKPTVTGIFKYLITPDSQCGTNPTDSGTITINFLPVKPTITPGSSTSFCSPGSVVLSTNATSGIEWQIGGNAITNAVTSSYTATNSGSYTVTSSINGCTSLVSDPIQVIANQAPSTPIISTSGGTEFCKGFGSILQTSSSVGTQWYRDGILLNGANKSNYVADTTGVYTVIVQDANSCVSGTSNSISITVHPLPVVSAIGNGNATFCAETDLQMTNTTSGGVWNVANSTIATIGSNGTAHGLSAGITTITYTVTDPNTSCSNTVSTLIKVEPLPAKPTISLSGPTSFCTPDSVILTSSASTGNFWIKDGKQIIGATNQSYTASSSGTYTLLNKLTFCFSHESDPIDVTANATLSIPTLKVSGSKDICDGESVKLFTSNAFGNEWYRDGILISYETGRSYTTNLSGIYTVKSVNTNGCVSGTSLPVNVTINPLPAISAISGNTVICEGSIGQLSNSYSGGIWTTSNSGIINVNAHGQMQALASGSAIIKYIATNANGCSSIASKLVSVTALPTKPSITAGGATAFCTPGSVVLNSSATIGNQWYKDGNLISGEISNKYTATTSGTYTVISTQNNCASKVSDQMEVISNAAPTAPVLKASKLTTICDGKTVKLTTSNTGGVEWYKDGVLLNGITGSTYTVSVSGSYSIKATSTKGCESGTSFPVVITVNPLPPATIINGASVFCAGSNTLMSSNTSGGVWYSSNTGIASIDASGSVLALSDGNTTISYTVTNNSGCSVTATKLVSVTALPAKPTITAGGPTAFCAPGSVALNSSNSIGNQWYKDGTLLNGETSTSYTATASGTYTIISTENNCASAVSDPIEVISNTTPSAPVLKAASTTTICNGALVKLNTSNTAGSEWYKDGVLVNGVTGSSYTVSASGSYTVKATSTKGCESGTSLPVVITVNPLPVVADITGITSICETTNTKLNNQTPGGVWSSANTSIITVDATGNVKGITAGIAKINYTVTNNLGCNSSASTIVTVKTTPTVAAISGVSVVCANSNTQFINTTSGGIWLSNNIGIATIDGSGLIQGINAGSTTISYTVTNNSGCSNTTTKNISVTALPTKPTISAAGATAFCTPGSVVLNSSASSGNQWYKDGNIINGETNASVTATTSGSYTLVNSQNSCASFVSDQVEVIANATPTIPVLKASKMTTVCDGESVKLNTSNTSGTEWFKDGVLISGITSSSYSATVSGSYTIKATSTKSCESGTSLPVVITVNPMPIVAPISGASVICESSSTQLNSNTSGGIWSSSNIAIATVDASGSVQAISGGSTTISYTVTNASGCSISNTKSISVTVLPSRPIITAGGSTAFCTPGSVVLNSNVVTGNQWYKDGILLNGETNTIYTATNSGSYTIINTLNGCSSLESDQIEVTANKTPSIPVLKAAKSTTICDGSSVKLFTSNNGVNEWYRDGALIAGTNGNTYTATLSGNYSIKTENLKGCVSGSSNPVIIAVNQTADVSAINGVSKFCVNENAQLNNTTVGGNWSSNNSGIISIDGNGSIKALNAGIAIISYKVYNANGTCATTVTKQINVTALPLKPIITAASATSFCSPGSVVLNSNSNTGNQWIKDGINISSAVSNNYTATTSGTYAVVNSQNGCSSPISDFLIISANTAAIPPVIKVSGSTSVCSGQEVKLYTSTSSGNEWYKDGTLIPGATSSSYQVTASGSYTLKANNISGCVSGTSAAIVITVNPLPNVSALTGPSTLCVNSSSPLTNTSKGGVWQSSNTGILTVDETGSIVGISSGAAFVNYTVANNNATCSTTVSKLITVNDLPSKPVITAQGATSFCTPGSVLLNSNAQIGNQWYKNGVSLNGETSTNYTATSSGSYTLVNTQNGCISAESDHVEITANSIPSLPVLKAVKTNVVCEGEAVKLVTSTQSNNLWYRNGILLNGVTGSSYDATLSGNYSVVSESPLGCISGTSNTVPVTIHINPYVLPIIGTTQLCEGLSTSYKNKNFDGKWFSTNTNVATIDKKGNLTALKQGNTDIVFTVTNSFGCATKVTSNITVLAVPQPAPIIGLQNVCRGLNTILTNVNPNGHWVSSNSALATINDAGLISGVTNGTLNVSYTITNQNGCTAVSTIPFVVNPLPLLTATSNLASVSKGLFVNLTATGVGAFQWSPTQDLAAPNSPTTTARVTAKTNYTVRLTDANGCISSASVPVDVVEDLYVNPVIVMTPNGDGINDRFIIKNLDQYPNNKLQIFDRTGKLLYETQNYANTWDGRIKGQLLTKDTYLFILSIQGNVVKKGTISLIR